VKEIQNFVITEREAINEAERPLMTVSIKADEDVKMGLITDVKQELRKANTLKINYSTRKGEVYGDE
jgi:biopolymer transport protein ExbD